MKIINLEFKRHICNKLFITTVLTISLFLSQIKFTFAAEGDAMWANTTTSTSLRSARFDGTTTDSMGNSYAVGYIDGPDNFNFGNGVTVSVANSFIRSNSIIVKYDPSGLAQWARSVEPNSPGHTYFKDVEVDSDNNVYAVGYSYLVGTYNFGNGVTVTTGSSNSIIIVKYNSSGDAQWARSTTVSPSNSRLSGITIDLDNNIYVGGFINGTGTFNFGNSVTASGGQSTWNPLVVKYNTSGVAQWARSTSGGEYSEIVGMTSDSNGNIYAVGEIDTSNTYDFGDGVTVAGGCATSSNILIVKYNPLGVAQWAKTVTGGGPDCYSYSYNAAVDSDQNIYLVGFIWGNNFEYNFGNGVTATAGYSGNGWSAILVKYNPLGETQWAKTVEAGAPDWSNFDAISIDANNNIFAAGDMDGTSAFNFGNGVIATGASTTNSLLVKYNTSGVAQWAKTVEPGATNLSSISDVSIDLDGNIFAVGDINGTSAFDFGNSVVVTGITSNNLFILKYEGVTVLTPTPTPTISSINNTSDSNSSPSCQDIAPLTSPYLFQIDTSISSATLYFAPAQSPVNKYFISYGTEKDYMQYGVEYNQVQSDGVLSYTINLLAPNTTYYFKIRAGNGCMPGGWSNILWANTNNQQFYSYNQLIFKVPKSTKDIVTPVKSTPLAKSDELQILPKEGYIPYNVEVIPEHKVSFVKKVFDFLSSIFQH